MLRVKTLATACLLSFASIALAAPPTTPAPTPQAVAPLVKMLFASEEAGSKIEALAVAGSIVVHTADPPLKGSPPPRSLAAELVFDTSKEGSDVRKRIEQLLALSVVDGAKKRPPLVTITWAGNLPPFEGVVANLAVKYTLFLPNGQPVRASVSVDVREAPRCIRDSMCAVGQVCLTGRCANAPARAPAPSASSSP
jgi:hypothetical protein